jgi:hypothetical protein
MIKPNFFIVGKPKSGTTALHLMLEQHPDVYMSPVKEPHYFARDHVEAARQRNRGYRGLPYKDLDSYLALFEGAATEKIVGEASTDYLYSRCAAQEIAKFNPDAKILMVLREPVDFMYSFHGQLLRSGNEDEGDFGKALMLEESRRRGENIPASTSNPGILLYAEQAKYCEQVERFIGAFGHVQVQIVIYDDFRDDNLAVCREVFRFLGVDPDFQPVSKEVNPSRAVRAPKLANWLIYHGERKAGSIKQRAPRWLVAPVAWLMKRLIFSGRASAPLDSALKSELRTKFKPEVERLSGIVGVDLVKKWGYD